MFLVHTFKSLCIHVAQILVTSNHFCTTFCNFSCSRTAKHWQKSMSGSGSVSYGAPSPVARLRVCSLRPFKDATSFIHLFIHSFSQSVSQSVSQSISHSFIHLFIHIEHLYSASSRKLLRCARVCSVFGIIFHQACMLFS